MCSRASRSGRDATARRASRNLAGRSGRPRTGGRATRWTQSGHRCPGRCPSQRSVAVARPALRSTLRGPTERNPAASGRSRVETPKSSQRTSNPQVPGSNPGGGVWECLRRTILLEGLERVLAAGALDDARRPRGGGRGRDGAREEDGSTQQKGERAPRGGALFPLGLSAAQSRRAPPHCFQISLEIP